MKRQIDLMYSKDNNKQLHFHCGNCGEEMGYDEIRECKSRINPDEIWLPKPEQYHLTQPKRPSRLLRLLWTCIGMVIGVLWSTLILYLIN